MKTLDRIILHCDLNNFFASVSLLENQTLINRPVAVGGDKEQRHGIILAKNEIAKKFGVKTAEAIWEAKRKCPDLIILPPDYKKYTEYSLRAKEIYQRYTDMIEPFGIDECWLDITGSTLLFGSGEEIAHKIRREIKKELGITISVGVSFNKVFAKLGSDMKKPDAVTVISRENFKEKVWPLGIEVLLFAGRKTVEKLNSSGVFTVGDITLCSDDMLTRLLGKNGIDLKRYALGEDNSKVSDAHLHEKPKSIGRSVTESADFTNSDEVWQTFITLSEEISKNLRKHGLYAGGVQIHTRNSELKIKEFSRKLDTPTDMSLVIAKAGLSLFEENYYWDLPLRSVGIRAINLKDAVYARQQDIFSDFELTDKKEKIENSIYEIREKFGDKSIKRGRNS
ncbi:MAG: DNA polymerase IV [Clostridiales bacterium]|nr:DNA polymerase IV [Candidatus Equinaster intestinalis]